MGGPGSLGRCPLSHATSAAERVRIERIASGGDGVGRLDDGRVVFIPRAAPGDLVEAVRIRREARMARASIGQVLEPGPGRTEPRCPHYDGDRCGGCQLQHLEPGAQRDARRAIVGDALRRLGKFTVADPAIVPADSDWAYRTRITLHQGPGGAVGFHRLGEAGRVFELGQCHIAAPDLNALWRQVQAARRWLPSGLDTLTLRRERNGVLHVLVRGNDAAWPGATQFARHLAEHGVVTWWQPEAGAARVIVVERPATLDHRPSNSEAFPATVFEQVNPTMGDKVRQFAVDALGDVQGRAGWDLYAGIGEASMLLAARGAQVESVERDARAVNLAAAAAGGGAVTRHAATAEAAVASLGPADFVLANPPRTGLAAEVVDAIAARRPGRFVYVSCDPATLARDLRRLGPAWSLDAVTAFDLFPQTAHVETVAVVSPA